MLNAYDVMAEVMAALGPSDTRTYDDVFHKVRDRFGIQVIPMRGARVLNDGMHLIHSTRNGMKHCIAVVVRGAAPTRIFHGRHTWTQEPDEFKRLLEQCS